MVNDAKSCAAGEPVSERDRILAMHADHTDRPVVSFSSME
jgi:hypothetical protein